MIDVVIPVYGAEAQTRRCIESVLASRAATPFEVLAVDDASPEPAIRTWLDELAAAGRIALLRNERNAGFVASANRGMARHGDRDVVLLNSDTEVANDWLDRLAEAARRAQDIATVTPFSNNATICSYPFEGWDGGVPGTLGLAALDRLFAAANPGRDLELPTGVGFCMYIRRDCLRALGAFDEQRFGRGYGEENDFCRRAAKAGWRNVLACDVFVFHEGSASFTGERAARVEAATRALLEVHPEYTRLVQEFIERDPAAEARAAVDAARASLGGEEARQVLAERGRQHRRALAHLKECRDHSARLEVAFAQAQAIVRERDEDVARLGGSLRQLDEELQKVRAGLAHAEKLAFERADELQAIRRNPLWRAYQFAMRRWR